MLARKNFTMNGTKSEEIVEDFLSMLVDLTVNSKPLINFLTLLAKKHTSHAEAIVQAVGDHLRKVSSALKLPVLYLIDSIMKNVGGNYIPLFSRCISKYFACVFKEADSKARLQLLHLRRTWNNLVFDEDLQIVDGQVNVLDQKWMANILLSPLKQTSTKILVNPRFLPSAPLKETSSPVCAENISEDSEDNCSEMAQRNELLLQVQQASKGTVGEGSLLESKNKNDVKNSLTNMVASDPPQAVDQPSNMTFQDAQVVQNQADSTTMESSMMEQGSKLSMQASNSEPLTCSEKVSTHSTFASSSDVEHVDVTPPAATSAVDAKILQVKAQASNISQSKDLENNDNSRKSAGVCSKPAIFCKPTFPYKRKHQSLETQCEAQRKGHYEETQSSFSKSRSGAFSKTVLPTLEMDPSQVPPQNRRCYQWQPQVGSSRSKKLIDDSRLKISNVIPHLRLKEKRPLLPLPSENFHSHNGVTSSSAIRGSLNRWKSFRPSSEEFVVTLPQPSQAVLDRIDKDAGNTVMLNNEAREIHFYGNIAVVIISDNDVREISFQPGGAFIILNNVVVHCAFHEPERKIFMGNDSYRVRLGAPTRELYVNDEWFQCHFNGAPREIQLSTGEILMVRLQASTTPQVHIGSQRQDLIAGQVTLSIDSKYYVRLLLDSKPQRFDINGVPHVLQFADSLLTVLVNNQPVNLKFGGPPIPFAVNGGKHFVRLSELPKGIVPGEVNLSNFSLSSLATTMTPPFPLPCYSPAQNLFQVPASYSPFRRARGKKRDRLFRMQKNSQRHAQSVLPYDNNQKHLSQELNMTISSCLSNVITQNARAKFFDSNENCTSLEVPPVALSPASGFDKPIYEPNVDIHALFQSLCASGLLIPRDKDHNNSMESQKPPKEDALEKIHAVDFKDSTSLKVNQPGLVRLLYSGAQCSLCGTRFLSKENVEFQNHLDWHFEQNHSNKHSSKTQSRLWYCNASAWVDSKDPLENKGCAWNESHMFCNTKSVPSHEYPQGTYCEVCFEKFEEFFNEDEDEWHLKNCVSENGLTYHPLCFKDIKMKANTAKGIPFLEEMYTEDFAKDHPRDQAGLLLKPLRKKSEKENFPEKFDLQTSKPAQLKKLGKESHEIADSCCESEQEGKSQHEGKVQEQENLKISEVQVNLNSHSLVLLRDEDLEGCHLSSSSLDKLCSEGFKNSPTDQSFQINQTSVKEVVIATECLVDSFNCNADTLIIKPKLKSRKLTQLPPITKSSETSSLCSIA